MQFSAGDAAVSGFDFIRRHPRPVIRWTVFSVAVSLLVTVIGLLLVGPTYLDLAARSRQQVSPQAVAKTFSAMALIVVVFALPAMLAMQSAVLRALLVGPAGGRWEGLSLGKRELRLLGVYVLMGLSLFGVEIVGGAATVILVHFKQPLFVTAGVVVGIATFCAMVLVVARLSLAPVVLMADGSQPLKRSWALTKGRFWPLFGAFLLLTVMLILAYLAVELIFALPLLTTLGSGGWSALFQPDKTITSLTAPQMIFRLGPAVVHALLSAVLAVLPASVAVEAYKAFSADRP